MWNTLKKILLPLLKAKHPNGVRDPEYLFAVKTESDCISVTDPDGTHMSIQFSDLSAVYVGTNDSGPWGMDVWYILVGPDGKDQCWFPMGATGQEAAWDRLSQLPDFVWRGLNSTENLRHLCWQRTSA